MIESGMYNMDEVRELERLAAAKDLLGAIEYVEALPLELQGRWEIQDMLGGVCAVCGELEMAKQFYRAALKQCPSNPELLQNLLNVGRSLRKKLHTDSIQTLLWTVFVEEKKIYSQRRMANKSFVGIIGLKNYFCCATIYLLTENLRDS